MKTEDDLLKRLRAQQDATRVVPEVERGGDPGTLARIASLFAPFSSEEADRVMREAEDEARGRIPREPGQNYIQSRQPSLLERGLAYLPEPIEDAVMSAASGISRSPAGAVARYLSSGDFLGDLETGGAKAASGLLRIGRERMNREALEQALESGEAELKRRRNPAVGAKRTELKPGLGGKQPLILRDPREIALEVGQYVEPESPALGELFGVSRADLRNMAMERPLTTDYVPAVFAENPSGSAAAQSIMTPRNRQRLVDVFEEVDEAAPELVEGMYGWYMMEPLYDRAVQLFGPELGVKYVDELMATGGAMSPQSTVTNELRKATAERFFSKLGMGDEFLEYGTRARGSRELPEFEFDYPSSIGMRSQIENARAFRETGALPETPKTDLYIRASGSPGRSAFGFQNNMPVPDAHFSRGVGMPFSRTGGDIYSSMSGAELQTFAPFFNDIARDLGVNPVSAQAIMWGALGPSTGVKTGLGAPKLEILSNQIMSLARETGLPPDLVRDAVISGDIPLDNPGKEMLRRIFGVREGPTVPVLR